MTILLEDELDELEEDAEPEPEEDEASPTGTSWRSENFKRKPGRPSYAVVKQSESNRQALVLQRLVVRCSTCSWSTEDRADRAIEAMRLHRPCRA